SVEYRAQADTNDTHITQGANTYRVTATGVDAAWIDERTANAGANDDLDLTDLVSGLGFTSVSVVFIEINSTSGSLLVGKVASVTNGWEGPFGTVAGGVQEVLAEGSYFNARRNVGWTVDATHKVLRVNNP